MGAVPDGLGGLHVRAGDQDAAPATLAHGAARLVQQEQHAEQIGVDRMAHPVEILVEKGAGARTVPGAGQYHLDRLTAALQLGPQAFDTLDRREIRLHRQHHRAEVAAGLGGELDFRLLGGDHQVEAVFGAAFGQFEANAGRGAGDEGK